MSAAAWRVAPSFVGARALVIGRQIETSNPTVTQIVRATTSVIPPGFSKCMGCGRFIGGSSACLYCTPVQPTAEEVGRPSKETEQSDLPR